MEIEVSEEVKNHNRELVKKYPFLLPRNRFSDEVNEDYDYEFTELDSMPEGWRKAFGEQMCEEIAQALRKIDYLDKYRILQIKEKYGSLRWYDAGASDEVFKIINKYEELSAVTCVNCGAPATKVSTGWICPWCDKCAEKLEGRDRFRDINEEDYEII